MEDFVRIPSRACLDAMKQWPRQMARIKCYARLAAYSPIMRDSCLINMCMLIESLNDDFKKYVPSRAPLTPQECGFTGAVDNFVELMYYIVNMPQKVLWAENRV
jgi:hypothetical protein